MREREKTEKNKQRKNGFINMLGNIHHIRGNEGYFKNNYFSAPVKIIYITNV